MLPKINTISIGKHTNYTDISNNLKKVTHSVILSDENRKEILERIAEELYRIFTHKSG